MKASCIWQCWMRELTGCFQRRSAGVPAVTDWGRGVRAALCQAIIRGGRGVGGLHSPDLGELCEGGLQVLQLGSKADPGGRRVVVALVRLAGEEACDAAGWAVLQVVGDRPRGGSGAVGDARKLGRRPVSSPGDGGAVLDRGVGELVRE